MIKNRNEQDLNTGHPKFGCDCEPLSRSRELTLFIFRIPSQTGRFDIQFPTPSFEGLISIYLPFGSWSNASLNATTICSIELTPVESTASGTREAFISRRL